MNAIEIAGYFDSRYRSDTGRRIDEMKLHKLLYLAQRESLVRHMQPLFQDDIYAWRFGPVVSSVRTAYRRNEIPYCGISGMSMETRDILNYVYDQYSRKSSWSLSRLTHMEGSWRSARARRCGGGGHRLIPIQDIKNDAMRLAQRRETLKEFGLV